MPALSLQLTVPVRVQRKTARSRAPVHGAVLASASADQRSFGSALAAAGVVAVLANPFVSARAADFIEVASEKEVNRAAALENTRAKAEGRAPREIRIKGSSALAVAPAVKAEVGGGASASPSAAKAMDKNEVAAGRKAAKDRALSDVREKALRDAAASAPAAKAKK